MNRAGFWHDQRGLTLLELMIATAISALVGGMLVLSLYQMNRLTPLYHDSLKLNHDLQSVAGMLNRDLVCATQVTIDNEVPEKTLSLKVRVYAFGTNRPPTEQTITYTYSSDAGVLSRYDGSQTVVVARHITSLDLAELPDRKVVVTYAVSNSRPQDTVTRESVLTFQRRPTQ